MGIENSNQPVHDFHHKTVLQNEVVFALQSHNALRGTLLDVTLGGGGHSLALLNASDAKTRVIGIDRDRRAREASAQRLAQFGDRFVVLAGKMSTAKDLLAGIGIERVQGIVADLGVSSPQLDDPTRGLSIKSEGPIDMRMDDSQSYTALDLIESWTEKELADVIYQYGEERASRPIARSIKRALEKNELQTTSDLVRAVHRVLGPPRSHGPKKIDPATRTFQALRIAVNDEIGELQTFLQTLPELLEDDGVVAIISFHSLEDREVKYAFRDTPELQVITKKPLEASDAEVAENPRARSAKLRVAQRRSRQDTDQTINKAKVPSQ